MPRARAAAVPTVIDTARLTESELHAHFKRTAPYEDLAFFLRHARLTDAIRQDAIALAAFVTTTGKTAIPRAEFYRRLRGLQARWREIGARRDQALARLDVAA